MFAAGFEFSEGDRQSFQWEMNEALEMATKTQVYAYTRGLSDTRHKEPVTICRICVCVCVFCECGVSGIVCSTDVVGCKDCTGKGTEETEGVLSERDNEREEGRKEGDREREGS